MIKKLLDQLLLMNDCGKLLKTPFKWLYMLHGILAFVPALAFVGVCIWQWDNFLSLLMDNFWGNFVSIFVLTLFVYVLVLLGYIAYHFWHNRKQNLDSTVETGSRVVAIPLVADLQQSKGEISSLYIAVAPVAAALLAYVACMLTNGFGFYTRGGVLWQLLLVAGVAVIACLLGYANLLLTRFVAERIRLVAQIGNDVHKMTITEEKAPLREADKSDVPFVMPRPTTSEVRGAVIAVVVAALFALCVSLGIVISINQAVGKSILVELTEKQQERGNNKLPGFYSFYSHTRMLADFAKEENQDYQYAKITYKSLYDYREKYYDNVGFLQNIANAAETAYDTKVRKPMEPKLKAEKAKWEKFAEENDPNHYLKIEVHTFNYSQSTYYSYWTYDRPAFYFTVSTPQGEVEAATVVLTARNRETERTNSGVGQFTMSLSDIRRYNSRDNYRYFTSLDDDSFWSTNYLDVQVRNVTMADGTVISSERLKEMPWSAQLYLNDPTEENEVHFVKECIDESYMSRNEYVESMQAERLSKEDKLMYQFLSTYEPYTEEGYFD